MNNYEKDLAYVKMKLMTSHTIDQIHQAKSAFRHFEDKWAIVLSPTDPTFQKDRRELLAIHEEKFTKISRAYLRN
jgi:hypothetical protein